MMDKYILDANGQPVPEPSILKWGQWFEAADRVLAFDEHGGVRVSTVFLGINHQRGDGPPLLWETMIFGGPHDGYQERFSTRSEALAGHAEAVKLALPQRGDFA